MKLRVGLVGLGDAWQQRHAPALRALVNIGVIFTLKDSLGVRAIAFGYVAGEAVRLLVLLVVIIRLRFFRIRFSPVLTPFLRDFLKKASYQSVGMVAIWLKPLIDKVMASWLGEGSVSVLYYADRLYIIPIAFLGTGLLATTLSHWSSRYYESGTKTFLQDVSRAARMVGAATAVVTVFLLIFYRPIVRIAFERGAFAAGNALEVQQVWFYYLLGLVPYIIARIYYQAHLVLKNTRFLMVYSFYLNGLAVGLNYLLMRKFGVSGIAISTTLSSVFAFFWLTRRVFVIGRQAIALDRVFAGLMVQGIGIWFGGQGFINMGVNLGVLPTKGLTLPLMSFGGSAMLMNLVALALVVRVDMENRQLMRGGRA